MKVNKFMAIRLLRVLAMMASFSVVAKIELVADQELQDGKSMTKKVDFSTLLSSSKKLHLV
jgi:hypothetical protein